THPAFARKDDGVQLSVSNAAFRNARAPCFAQLHASREPLHLRVPFLGTAPVAYRHADVVQILRDTAAFAVNPKTAGKSGRLGFMWWMPRAFKRLGDNMLGQDGADHKRLRRLVNHAFNKRGLSDLRTSIRALTEETLAPHIASGAPFDLVSTLARPLPLRVIADLLGLDRARLLEFARIAPRVVTLETSWHFARMVPAVFAMNRLLSEEAEAARRGDRGGLIREIVTSDPDGDALDDDEIVTMLFLLLFAGHETTVHLISTAVRALCLAGDTVAFPDGPASDVTPAQGAAVNELMRYCSPVEITEPRYAIADTEIAGHMLKRGAPVLIFLSAANRDPDVFDAPDALHLDRAPNPHVGFGGGPHVCLGAELARMEAAIALNALFNGTRRIALVDPDATPRWQYSPGFHGHASLMVRFV
ncbi:MAG: cytochrome P450, partial [Pseudomonadota bacterium]